MSTIGGDDASDAKMKPGFQIGGTMNYELSDAFSVQPSLVLTSKGYKVDNDFGKYTVNANYLEIPINAVYNINGLQIFAGPYLGVGLFGKVKPDEGDELTIKFKNDFKEGDLGDKETGASMIDFGLNFGVGYMVMENLQIQAGYGIGLSNINPKYEGEDPEDTNNNAAIQLTISYFLK
jgi:hypothetical protein